MKSLAALRNSVLLACLPFFAVACGGGSNSSQALLPAQTPVQSVVAGGPRAGYRAVSRLPVGPHRAGCTAFPYPAPGLPQACTVYVGGYISPDHAESPAEQIASTTTFEQEIGRKLAIDLHYYQWTDGFPGIGEANDLQNGRIPLISWHCGTTDADIISGQADALIGKRAAALAAYGGPVFLRWKWEMNLLYNTKCADSNNDKGGHYNRAYFVEAWHHIRAIFAANGASNVIWVWNPSSSGQPPDPYYPGGNYVDWIGFDHYDTTNDQSFYTTFSATHIQTGANLYTYKYFQPLYPTKPLIIGETGAEQSNQQYFIGGADQALQQNFPNIQAMMYWDSTGTRGQYQLQQYGLQAFTQFAAGPYEQGFYQQ